MFPHGFKGRCVTTTARHCVTGRQQTAADCSCNCRDGVIDRNWKYWRELSWQHLSWNYWESSQCSGIRMLGEPGWEYLVLKFFLAFWYLKNWLHHKKFNIKIYMVKSPMQELDWEFRLSFEHWIPINQNVPHICLRIFWKLMGFWGLCLVIGASQK